jgi:Probable cobalt transporter subunit (CbtB)
MSTFRVAVTQGGNMSQIAERTSVAVSVPSFTLGQVLPWLIFAGLLLLVAMYFVSAEQGATALFAGNAIHEWTHDGRHALGFPCH